MIFGDEKNTSCFVTIQYNFMFSSISFRKFVNIFYRSMLMGKTRNRSSVRVCSVTVNISVALQ